MGIHSALLTNCLVNFNYKPVNATTVKFDSSQESSESSEWEINFYLHFQVGTSQVTTLSTLQQIFIEMLVDLLGKGKVPTLLSKVKVTKQNVIKVKLNLNYLFS